MTALSSNLIDTIRRTPRPVEYQGKTFTLQGTNARSGLVIAELELVTDDGTPIGYITAYSDNEHGAVSARLFGDVMPQLFRSLEDALAELLKDQ